MRAMICRQWGGPEDLRLEEVEPAPLKAGQVRIRIRAAGVSFATTLVIAGKYQRRPPFPFAPGTEGSGVVTEVDAACKRLKLGDEVLRLTGGRGVDRVYAPVGGEVSAQSLRCMAVEGRICPIGFAAGTIPQIPANILLIKTIAVTGFNYGYYVGWSPHDARFEQAGHTFALMERIRGWCEAGLCRPHGDRTFRLDPAGQAMRALPERSVTGRVAIVMEP